MASRRASIIVGLLIIATLIALVLPIVQRFREASFVAQCRNNLRQIGLATNNYSFAMERLPALVDKGEGARTGRGMPSVSAELIPFIESTPLHFRPHEPAEHYYAHSSGKFDTSHLEFWSAWVRGEKVDAER